jgi:hypothetical protein
MSDIFERLKKLAPKLNLLREDPNARVHYELMSGGLVWSDELPPWDELESGESHCMRAIWRFRSSLIEDKPDERFRIKWSCFPIGQFFGGATGYEMERNVP